MKKKGTGIIKCLVTVAIVAVAVIVAYLYFYEYFHHPWTRDAQVRADVVGIAARVNGPVIRFAAKDNQRVKKGDLLFEIDPTLYRISVEEARASLEKDTAIYQNAKAERDRRTVLVSDKAISVEDYQKHQEVFQEAEAQVNKAKANLELAQQDLEYTKVYATVDGYVTGLELGPGTYVREGQPLFALIDISSYWVAAYFKETQLRHIRPGDRAEVVMLGDPDKRLSGRVESIGYGIIRDDGSLADLLPRVKPTIDWIRLAQRFPVRVKLDETDLSHHPRLGATASVYILGPSR